MTSPTWSAQTTITTNVARVWDVLVNPSLVKRYLRGTAIEADGRVGDTITWRGEWHGMSYEDP